MHTNCYHFYKRVQPTVTVVDLCQKKCWTPKIYDMLSWLNVISRIHIIAMFVIAEKQTIFDIRFLYSCCVHILTSYQTHLAEL